jgi:hypothetical protein
MGRVSNADADLHKHLCTEHWRDLRQASWIAAAAYSPLAVTSIPAPAELSVDQEQPGD